MGEPSDLDEGKSNAEKSQKPPAKAKTNSGMSPPAISKPTAAISEEKIVVYAVVVDDEPANRDFLVRLLEQAKFTVEGAVSGKQTLEIAERLGEQVKLVMVDQVLPDIKGIELLRTLRKKLPDAKLVMATMHDELNMMREAFGAGCTAFLVKPHGFMELFKRVQNVTEDTDCLDDLDGLIFDQLGPRPWRYGK